MDRYIYYGKGQKTVLTKGVNFLRQENYKGARLFCPTLSCFKEDIFKHINIPHIEHNKDIIHHVITVIFDLEYCFFALHRKEFL